MRSSRITMCKGLHDTNITVTNVSQILLAEVSNPKDCKGWQDPNIWSDPFHHLQRRQSKGFNSTYNSGISALYLITPSILMGPRSSATNLLIASTISDIVIPRLRYCKALSTTGPGMSSRTSPLAPEYRFPLMEPKPSETLCFASPAQNPTWLITPLSSGRVH